MSEMWIKNMHNRRNTYNRRFLDKDFRYSEQAIHVCDVRDVQVYRIL